jgi:hypothetical protein
MGSGLAARHDGAWRGWPAARDRLGVPPKATFVLLMSGAWGLRPAPGGMVLSSEAGGDFLPGAGRHSLTRIVPG